MTDTPAQPVEQPADVGGGVGPGFLLDKRVRHDQPATGFRTGIEPVFLAASVPARPGQRVLEAGTATGAALLCLTWRVPGVCGVGVERNAGCAELARSNAAANRFNGLSFVTGALEDQAFEAPFDHAIANPPWHAPSGTPSPIGRRNEAKRAEGGPVPVWVRHMAAALRAGGTLTLIVPPALVPLCLRVMDDSDCAPSAIYPLWPKPDRPAKLVLVRGHRGGARALSVLPGLVLHEADGRFTPAANAVLRDGEALRLDGTGSGTS